MPTRAMMPTIKRLIKCLSQTMGFFSKRRFFRNGSSLKKMNAGGIVIQNNTKVFAGHQAYTA